MQGYFKDHLAAFYYFYRVKITFRYFSLLFVLISVIGLSSCKEKTQLDLLTEEKGTYLSIKKYILDEWETHAGEPLVFKKTVTENGKKDSSVTNVERMNWPEVLDPFIASDIGDKKYLNKYTFSQFDDETDNTHNLMYVANGEELFTQKLLVTVDITTGQIRGIYIETFKKILWSSTTRKLFYSPLRTIQIQEYNKNLLGMKNEKVIQYDVVR